MWIFFHGVPTHDIKDIEFLIFYEFENLKKLLILFILTMAIAKGTLVYLE